MFGARVGDGVVLRPRLRVKFPWKLRIGDRSWIGEDVWIHNQADVSIGSDAVVSQGSFLTTGSHDHRGDMSLSTRPITIEDGVWVTARCVVLSGSCVRRSALVLPGTVVRGEVPAASLFGGNPGVVCGERFPSSIESLP
jgi:putative colanic acid biosynthesis acetyltransferase WcaF